MHTKNDPKRLVGVVQMFRIRVATAESKLKLLRDQARQAKRRRKEAKRLAERARKEFKRFKADVAALKQSLARAEVMLFQAGGRALARKTAKARLSVNRSTRPLKRPKSVAHAPRRLARPPQSLRPRRATRKKPALAKAKVVSAGLTEAAVFETTPSTPPITGPNT